MGYPFCPDAFIQESAMAPSPRPCSLGTESMRHAIGHPVSHLLDEGLDRGLIALEDADPDEGDVRTLALELGEMRDGRPAGTAPGRPEFDDVNLASFEGLDGLALDERFEFEPGCRIADAQRLGLD